MAGERGVTVSKLIGEILGEWAAVEKVGRRERTVRDMRQQELFGEMGKDVGEIP